MQKGETRLLRKDARIYVSKEGLSGKMEMSSPIKQKEARIWAANGNCTIFQRETWQFPPHSEMNKKKMCA
ncbi:MAG: hypothetical protein R3E79_50390 [Caldilineaceae bacterium]